MSGDVKVGVIVIAEAVAAESVPLTEKVYLPLLHVPVAILDAVKVGSFAWSPAPQVALPVIV